MSKKEERDPKKKLEEIKKIIDKFKDQVLKKFDEYVIGISLLPPDKKDVESINLIVLVDDSDSKKMSKFELKDKLSRIIGEIGEKIYKKLKPNTILLSEFWADCYDGKYELLRMIGISAIVFDKGVLGAAKIGELHKSMVIKKFEKYIVSYVLFGSLTRGEATPKSDIDVAIIVDDTDVKRMTRAELKDKLRAIIIGMGQEAGDITGIKNKLNIQVYILTDFWDSIKEANPVIFTILRDGVPYYDRGMFMPWKHLLAMGKIKPSPEAIDMFMSSGEKVIERVKQKMKSLVESDLYWSTLTPTQAALMLYGISPPTPKETINLVEEIFVKKEKLLEKPYVDILKNIRDYYKKLEHGEIKEISGKEIDKLVSDADKYLKRIKRLFKQIEKIRLEKHIVDNYDNVCTIVRDALIASGLKEVKEEELIREFASNLVNKGKVPDKLLRTLKDVFKAKRDYETGDLGKTDADKILKESRLFIKMMIEYLQRARGMELERARVRFKYGNKFGEVILLDDCAFIIEDLDADDRKMHRAAVNKDGSFGKHVDTSIEEFEKHIAKAKFPDRAFIKMGLFEELKKLFGKEVEILVK